MELNPRSSLWRPGAESGNYFALPGLQGIHVDYVNLIRQDVGACMTIISECICTVLNTPIEEFHHKSDVNGQGKRGKWPKSSQNSYYARQLFCYLMLKGLFEGVHPETVGKFIYPGYHRGSVKSSKERGKHIIETKEVSERVMNEILFLIAVKLSTVPKSTFQDFL